AYAKPWPTRRHIPHGPNTRRTLMTVTTQSAPCVAPIFQLPPRAEVTPMRGYYLVTLGASHAHLVLKTRTCTCADGASCPSVLGVAEYLAAGGERAADIPAHHVIPDRCPVCGGPVRFEPRLCSLTRGAGWVCLTAAAQGGPGEMTDWPEHLRIPGRSHYWH